MRRSNARVAEAVDRPHINKEKKKMDNSIKLKFRPNQSLRSTNLFSRNQKQPHLTKSNIYIIGFLTFVFVSSCYLYFNSRNPVQKRYRIIIDGGSTGSRIHVFQYVIKDGAPVFDLSGKKGLASMRVSPGLSAFAEDPKGAGASVLELLEFARERIPGEKWGETEVRLMATAGLRMLDLSVQERILESCRNVLRTSGFAFRNDWASVISGSDEGVYAWVVANYALGTLGDDPQETTGIIELGGASAQVTFFSSAAIPPEFSQTVKFGNVSYSLYSHSLLEFGQNVAFDLIRWSMFAKESFGNKEPVDPCSPKGYKHNAMIGNYTPGSFVEMNEQSSVLHSKLMVAGKKFCEDDWSKLKRKYPTFKDEDLHRYCFSSAYIIALLHDSLGIALDDKRIRYANQVSDIPLDWALGAFISQIMSELDVGQLYPVKSILGVDSWTLAFVIFLLIGAAYFGSKWRNPPNVKTIYDLEKGKYIVTRIGRHS
ncbi:Nucleoside phosphatase GDA1/CD39 [Cynara cardunculus var. scolymus]|uniref:Nucleoside phosphatase GDA1/CD39 n=1 Tax=Cynara cardunculus var. scolymus TaxID=59895 RepID=A0A103XVP1_CYNCS|nr:Nucleoside phosphatase GDA1/CD39 [Cynara cardunculus var. scolymus]